jgi:hypothetical protein
MIRPVPISIENWFPRSRPVPGFGDQLFNNEIIATIPLYFKVLDAARYEKVYWAFCGLDDGQGPVSVARV